jgi:Protein of unknown function (DUF1670)
MKQKYSSKESTFNPQYHKSFVGALGAFFEQECPQIGGFRTREVLVKCINQMVMKFFPKTNHMRSGQITWTTVHKDARCSYGNSIKNTKLTNVVLDLVKEGETLERAEGKRLYEIRKDTIARICHQAFKQGGCMTNAEIALILKIAPRIVGKYIGEIENETQTVLPRRGTIHDIGPCMTHKKIIINKLFIEQKTVQQVSLETYHSVGAIENYIVPFKQILLCRQKGMKTEEIAFSVRKTVRLVKEYEKIINEYKDRNYILKKLMNLEVGIDSSFEKMIDSMP